jgi:DNA helicase TIP49 (TBP-interacting protein)
MKETEIAMQSMRDKMLRKVKEYKEKSCTKDGNIKSRNLTEVESKGLKDIGERIKQEEIVIFESDKSGKFTVDTPKIYKQALQKHIEGDEIIDD